MIHAGYNILLFCFLCCLRHHCLVAVLDESGQLLGPQFLEVALDLAEHELDRVVLRTVWDIVDPTKAEPPHGLLRPL